MAKKEENIKAKIKILSEKDPMVKENYNLLVIKFWATYEGVEEMLDVVNATPAESITRAFRDLVKKGEIKLSKKRQRSRKLEEKRFRKTYEVHKI